MLYKKRKPNIISKIILRILLPILWSLAIPLVIADIWIEIYHRILFPLYGLPYVKRGNYIQIMDRAKLPYLNIIQKIYCMYCGYANGLVRYWVQIGGETEHYRCGIQHQKKKNFVAEEYQKKFAKYGDKNDFIKKYCRKGVLCLMVGIVMTGNSVSAAGTPKDIATNQYRESIQYLYDHGVVEGYPDGTFGPNREITRAEIMKIILESSVDDIGLGKNCFPDVRTEWFAKYACYAVDHGIVKGYTDGMFRPSQNVSFAEALKMALGSFDKNVGQANGNDAWYQPYFDFVHNNNIFSKYGLLPNKNITRGEMAYLVHQLMLEKAGSIQFDGVRDVASAGCGKEPPSSVPTSSVVNGLTRHYITVIGNTYNKNIPMKIIFAFHGRTNPNTEVQEYYDLDEESNGNAIIIYPAGLPEEGPTRGWSNPGDHSDQLRDFALFDQLLKEFEDKYCINKDQVFVAGHSLGAWFTNTLSCARGNVIRAIGSVGGGTTINKCNGPVAGMIMQNPEDNLSPYSAAVTARDQMLKQNGCGTKTEPYGSVGNCVKYTDCQKDAPVIWCPYTDSYFHGGFYPHMWPDYAGQTIMDFFEGLGN